MVRSFQTYQLHLMIDKKISLIVGRLGEFTFPAGYYIYTGSAKKNIDARIKRHYSKAKKIRWHIDYLLSQQNCTIILTKKFRQDECLVNQSTKGSDLVAKFGASDCQHGCRSHLKYIGIMK